MVCQGVFIHFSRYWGEPPTNTIPTEIKQLFLPAFRFTRDDKMFDIAVGSVDTLLEHTVGHDCALSG